MRRIAFIILLSLGLLGSAWFVAQPGAQPPARAPSPTIAPGPALVEAAPAADKLTIAFSGAQSAAEAPTDELAQANVLEQALASEECPSEVEALNIVSRVTSNWDFGDASRAIDRVSIPHQDCETVRTALARSRGAAETTSGWSYAPNQDRETSIIGDGYAVGGDSGPGYQG